ncbi:MAG TPA: glutamate racemase [Candidatus Saccharimonadales bacterium]
MSKIGVFDSGVGGLSVAEAIQEALPDDIVVFRNDKEHVPYGDKVPQQVLEYVVPILTSLVDEGCKVIVIACNTVTTNHIEKLRGLIPVPLVGMEPMVKPASEITKSSIIAVCATPATLASKRYMWLKDTYARRVKVIEPDCRNWAAMIERDQINEQSIRGQIDGVCAQGADVIVLGCTHYHWIKELIQDIAANRAVVVQPEEQVIEQLKRVLAKTRAR